MDSSITLDKVRESLMNVVDPEVGLNIVDLGLVYRIDIEPEAVSVQFTLTTPYCPLEEYISGGIQDAIESNFKVKCRTQVVWDPPWSPALIDEAARLALGI